MISHLEGLVAEGRDCGTMVFPKAFLKIFLEAGEEVRAERRAESRGQMRKEVLKAQRERDRRDKNRSFAPAHPASDCITISTEQLSVSEVVDRIYDLAIKKGL